MFINTFEKFFGSEFNAKSLTVTFVKNTGIEIMDFFQKTLTSNSSLGGFHVCQPSA